jgi:hypothetical protein
MQVSERYARILVREPVCDSSSVRERDSIVGEDTMLHGGGFDSRLVN